MIDKINGAAFKEMVLFGAACIAGHAISVTAPNSFAAQSCSHSVWRALRAISALLYHEANMRARK